MEERIIKDINNLLTQLFQKMKEAGYEWDAEKKESKEIVAHKFNIHDCIVKKHNSDINDFGYFIVTDIAGGKYWYNDRIICDISEQDEWELYEPVEENHVWSKKDEHEVAVLEAYIRSKDWNKSHIDRALGIVDELVNKVKFLRPQNTWKPSDEQLTWLYRAADMSDKDSRQKQVLNELLEQLRKLREDKK